LSTSLASIWPSSVFIRRDTCGPLVRGHGPLTSHLRTDQPLYEQGCILIPCLNAYLFFVVGVLHLISSAVLGFVGLYHAVFGPEILTAEFFAYSWKDKNKATTILSIHVILLGLGAYLLIYESDGVRWLYDPWLSYGGDVRLVDDVLAVNAPWLTEARLP
jgi:photosystem II CP43 chlorophyll apoprotein